MSATIMSPKLVQSRCVFRRDRVIFNHCSKRYHWSVKGRSDPPFIWCLPIRQKILNISQIAVTFHRVRAPFFTQTGLQSTSTADVPSLYELLFQQSHLFLICVVLTYNDSRALANSKESSVSAPGNSPSSFGFPGKFLFCTGRTVTTKLLNLVPPRHLDDCHAIHFLY